MRKSRPRRASAYPNNRREDSSQNKYDPAFDDGGRQSPNLVGGRRSLRIAAARQRSAVGVDPAVIQDFEFRVKPGNIKDLSVDYSASFFLEENHVLALAKHEYRFLTRRSLAQATTDFNILSVIDKSIVEQNPALIEYHNRQLHEGIESALSGVPTFFGVSNYCHWAIIALLPSGNGEVRVVYMNSAYGEGAESYFGCKPVGLGLCQAVISQINSKPLEDGSTRAPIFAEHIYLDLAQQIENNCGAVAGLNIAGIAAWYKKMEAGEIQVPLEKFLGSLRHNDASSLSRKKAFEALVKDHFSWIKIGLIPNSSFKPIASSSVRKAVMNNEYYIEIHSQILRDKEETERRYREEQLSLMKVYDIKLQEKMLKALNHELTPIKKVNAQDLKNVAVASGGRPRDIAKNYAPLKRTAESAQERGGLSEKKKSKFNHGGDRQALPEGDEDTYDDNETGEDGYEHKKAELEDKARVVKYGRRRDGSPEKKKLKLDQGGGRHSLFEDDKDLYMEDEADEEGHWHKQSELEDKARAVEDGQYDEEESYVPRANKPDSYPDDLIHGLLAAHCADETGKLAGKSKVKAGDTVEFSAGDALYVRFMADEVDLNKHLSDWSVYGVIAGSSTGYLGIIYVNQVEHQLVLAHRSTNFALSLTTKNFLGQSGAQTDVESALMGRIVAHQAYAYKATEMAVDHAKELGFILSITGHSLGAWLAELSVFYCNTDMNYKNVKGVTFDGPGSYEMMKQMSASDIRGVSAIFKDGELDIVSYLSAPNVVNTANKHVGIVYRVFPEIEHAAPNWLAKVTGKKNMDALLANAGHDLPYILPYFDIKTGIPSKAKLVKKWPSITHKKYGDSSESLFSKHVNDLVKGESFIAKMGRKLKIKIADTALSRLVGKEASTLGSLAYFIRDLANGQVNLDQFWEVHKYLDKSIGFDESPQDAVGKFWRLYKGNYRTEEVDLYSREKSGELDRWLKKLKQSEARLGQVSVELYELVQSCLELYVYKDSGKQIQSKGVTIAKLRDTMRILLHKYEEELKALIDAPATSLTIAPYFPNKIITQSKFVGRTKELEAIQAKLGSSKITIIRGMPGVGKTSLIRHSVQGSEEYIPIWLNADSKESLGRSYGEFGEKSLRLKLNKLNEEMVMRTVNSKLSSSNQEILLIFDNLEDDYIEFYLENLPHKVKALITTRHPNLLSHHDNGIKLKPFDEQTSLDYLIQNGIKQREANLIIGKVGKLPYRLHLALGYKKSNRGKPINELLADLPSVKGELDLFAKKLMKKKPDEWKILQHMSWFDPDFIPEEILLRLLGGQREFAWKVIENLESLSLVEVVERDDNRGLSIHRETQEQIYMYTKESSQQLLLEAVALLNEFLPEVTNNPDEKWKAAKAYTSTVDYVFKYMDERGVVLPGEEGLALLNARLGGIYEEIFVATKKALIYKERALEIRKALYPDQNHPDVAGSLNDVGSTYADLGDAQKGLRYMEEALEMYKAIYPGQNHPDVANSLNNVGSSYEGLGYAQKGLKYMEEALEMRKALYPDQNHPDVAGSLNDVGSTYGVLGEAQKGLKYMEEALEMRKSLYPGQNHPDIASSLNNVGYTYKALGNAQKGLKYKEEALEMYKAIYPGQNHPDVAVSLNDVGSTYADLGDAQKGLKYMEEALERRKALYPGQNHPDIASSLNNVGDTYGALGKEQKGLKYKEEALEMYKALYPDQNHPDIANSLNNVGSSYEDLGNVQKGLKYMEEALEMRKSLYPGQNHPDIANSLNNVGDTYADLGEAQKGLKYMEEALEMYKALYPDQSHPEVANSLNNVGDTYADLGEAQKGLKYMEEALEMYKALYPDGHPQIAILLDNVSRIKANTISVSSVVKQVKEDKNQFKGEGTLDYSADDYPEYYNSGIDRILKLRMSSLGVGSNAVILKPRYCVGELSAAIGKLSDDIGAAISDENTQVILVPLNLYDKHWVGLLFRNAGALVEVTYMDPEQVAMLPWLKEELKNGLAMHGYESQFSDARLEKQRSNNCGFELVENFVYYLTGTRTTQEGAVYLHSLLVENSLLNLEEYGGRIEENNKLIGFLSNVVPIARPLDTRIAQVEGRARGEHTLLLTGETNSAMAINLLPAVKQFNRLWANWAKGKLEQVNSMIYKTNLRFKGLDLVVDSARLLRKPDLANAKRVALDSSYLYGMYSGVNGYSALVSGAETVYQLHKGEYYQAFNIAAITLSTMALPFILVQLNRPYLSFIYGAWVAANTVYGAITNAYSFVTELVYDDAGLQSVVAYRDAAKALSESFLQLIYDFGKVARGYEIQVNKLLCEKAKLDKQAQLEEKHGEFGGKLFNYIYKPMLEEQYDLANKILEGVVTQEEAQGLTLKHIKITSEPQIYEHCVEAISARDTEYEEYYCFNTQAQILDHVIISDSGGLEVIGQL